MLQIDSELRVRLEADVLIPVMLFEFTELGGGATERITTAPYDVDYGGNAYSSESNLVAVAIPEGQQELGRNVYSLTFAGARSDIFESIDFANLVRLEVRLLLKQDGELSATHFDVYRGFSSAIATEAADDEIETTVAFVGDLNDITYYSAYVLSEEGQARRGQGDTSLRYMSSTENIQWGRA